MKCLIVNCLKSGLVEFKVADCDEADDADWSSQPCINAQQLELHVKTKFADRNYLGTDRYRLEYFWLVDYLKGLPYRESIAGPVAQKEYSKPIPYADDATNAFYELTFGKYRNRTLAKVYRENPSYLRWIVDTFEDNESKRNVSEFLSSVDRGIDGAQEEASQ